MALVSYWEKDTSDLTPIFNESDTSVLANEKDHFCL